MRQIHIILAVLLILVAASLVFRPYAVQAQSPAPIKMWHVVNDNNGNMINADTNVPITGSVKALTCIAWNQCWAVVQ